MTHFLSQHLKGVHYFKDQGFDFDQTGISLILGENKNSGRDKQNTNAVGKSLFFSQLPEMIMDEPLVGTRADRIRKGARSLTFRKGRNVYEFRQSFGPSKIQVLKNGVDLEIHGIAPAYDFFRKKIGMSDAEVMTFMYLDSSVPHPLVSGDTAARKRFFLDFFQTSLGSLNSVRRIIQDEASRLQGIERAYKELTERAKELKNAIPKNLDQLIEECNLAEERLNTSSTRSEEYAPVLRLRDQLVAHSDAKETLERLEVSSKEELEAYEGKLTRRIKKLRDQYMEALRFADWKKSQAKLGSKLEEAHATLQAHPWFSKRDATQGTLDSAEKMRKKLKQSAERVNNTLEDIAEAVKRHTRTVETTTRTIEDLRHQIEHASGEADKCPTCGGKYDNKAAKKLVEVNERYLAEARDARRVAKEHLASDELSTQTVRDLQKLLTGTEEEIPKLIEGINALQLILESQGSEAMVDPGINAVEVDELLEKALATRSSLPTLFRYLELKAEYASIPIEKRRAALKFNIQEVQDLAIEVANKRAELERFKVLKEELGRIQLKRASQLEELSNKEAAELLVEATSKKGMERLMIRTLCKRLEEQVNKYAKMMFAEDYVFSFDLQTQFNITVTRRHGKREEVSDVRKLSGAERKLFALVLIPSLLAFVPKSKRSNLLILDEPTAAMGPANVDAFVRFLPLLNTVIPHIVVITPLSPAEYLKLNPRVYTVVKDKHTSVIVEKTPQVA